MKKDSMMKKLEKLVDDLLTNVDTIEPDELLKKQTVAKIGLEFVSMKNKMALADEEGSFFRDLEDDAEHLEEIKKGGF